MSLDKMPDLGTKPVSLTVKLPAQKHSGVDRLAEGLRELYKRGEFTDVALVCADRTFYAHRIVLAAESEVFKTGLASVSKETIDGRQEIRLAEISNPEAVKFMLDYMYQTDSAVWEDYNPRTQEINKDVLRLAQTFRLPGLTERAMHWLAKDLTTGNVVEVLTICEDFGLSQLGEKILEQLTQNKKALAEVANSPQIMKYPKLMQALLQQAAAVPDDPPPKKRSKK
ncbi:Spop [Symbiodinium pilosum]|uniref:Spop protein n=1 Tax=Symbiodinium pilosum TaxID=2952 RepID=A0A812LMB2_SYMPI|nr:Spop [Symbiodinium pilosum]